MDTMHYESFTYDKNLNMDMPDMSFQCLPTSQLAKLNRTRKILISLIAVELVSIQKNKYNIFERKFLFYYSLLT